MKIFQIILLIVIALMSLGAGAAKIMKMPQEVQFFETAGLSPTLLIVLGIVQVIGGLLLIVPKTRKPGAIIAGLGFLCSVITILMTGQIGFAAISLLPVLGAGFLATRDWRPISKTV
jgi:uncharacterized membrane protein YphA (DoxX/SURF4 family)